MFGYVTPLKSELKVKDYERFKCYYCSLCHHIKNLFGNLPRISLNYDMTFLALFLDDLDSEKASVRKIHCALHPLDTKIIFTNNNALSYASSINLILFYYKLIDDINDDDNLKSKVLKNVLSPYMKKLSPSIKDTELLIKENLTHLSNLENCKNFTCIDEICDPFSTIVGLIFKNYPNIIKNDSKNLRKTLFDFGYALGKWIYLIDALDDLESDIKKNKFNPLNYLYNNKNLDYNSFIEQNKMRIEFTILNCCSSCLENINKITFGRNKEIIYNTVELGLMDKYLKVINNIEKKGVSTNESI